MKEKFNRIKGYAFRVIVNDGTIYLINKGLYYECCTAGISNDSRRVD